MMPSPSQVAAYEQELAQFSPEDRKAFRNLLVEAFELLELQPSDLCERFDVSRPRVRRWLEGEGAPQPAFRSLVVEYLAERLRGAVAMGHAAQPRVPA